MAVSQGTTAMQPCKEHEVGISNNISSIDAKNMELKYAHGNQNANVRGSKFIKLQKGKFVKFS